jgi:hypothetical protein
MDLTDTIKKHISNIPGKRHRKKYVVFESDDWGSERIPSMEDLKYITASGIDIYGNPFNRLDSLETSDDLSALFDTLYDFRDRNDNHPVITANSVTANPDFQRIKDSGYLEYHFESTLQTYSRKKSCEKSYGLIKEGMAQGIYHPQFHGREHLNVKQWLSAIQSGNILLKKAFDAGIYGIDLDTNLTGRDNFMASFDGNYDSDILDHNAIVKEGILMFKDIFGYVSGSFIAPCYIWHPSLEKSLKENGIKYIQGLPIQYAPADGRKYRKIYHYQGEMNKMNMVYFVRNCFFEPSLNNRIDWIKDCISRMKIIFFWGKPAIIGTHRINFMGSLNEENRKANLKLFGDLLKTILETWPDVEFTTTDRLGEHY